MRGGRQLYLFDGLDPEGRVTTFSHDVRRRTLTETDNAGETTTYTYDGNGNRLTRSRPALPGAWTYHYDGVNRLTGVDDPLGHATTYAYDKDGNRTAETDAEGQTKHWEYDVLNRPTAKVYPDSAREEYTYDGNGNRITLKDALGQTITYAYDEINRETLRSYPPPIPPTTDDLVSIATTYDANGNSLTVTETFTGTPVTRTTTHTFDAFDRMESVTDRFGLTLSYTYDANGNRVTLQDPAGLVTRYTFDALNRMIAVSTGSGVATYDYFSDSRRKKVTYPNASFETLTYDAAGRIQSLENRQSATSVLSRYDYSYDKNGNRTKQIETRGTPAVPATTTYAFDAADRLIDVVYPDKHTVYTLDGVGDRLTERETAPDGSALTDRTYSYNSRHQVTAVSDGIHAANGVIYTYDANGNQLTRTVGGAGGVTTSFTFDVRDQLTSVLQGTSLLGAYGYDSRGLRVVKQGSLGYVHYTYDDHSVLYETDAFGAALAKFDYGSDRLLSLTPATGGRQFYLFDGLGSVTDLTNLDGSLRASYQYDAWGNFRSTSGQSFNLFGFTGHERDPETGLYYFKHRFYDPMLGRFLTEDPRDGMADNPPSLHRYLYAYVNPTVYWDPDGRAVGDWWDPRSYKDVDLSSKAASERTAKFLKAEVKGFVNAPVKIVKGLAALPGKVVEKAAEVATHPIETAQNIGKEVAQVVQHPLDSAAKAAKGVDDAVESYANSSIEHQDDVVGNQLFGVVLLGGAGKVAQAGSEIAELGDAIGDATAQGFQEGAAEGIEELTPQFEIPVKAPPVGEAGAVTAPAATEEAVQATITAESAEGAGVKAGTAEATDSAAAMTDTSVGEGAPKSGVDPYEVDTYGNLQKRSLTGDGLDLDHQPSHASNVEREESQLGRELTPDEVKVVRDRGTAVAVPQKWHQKLSPTYGGRNTALKIKTDAADPLAAAIRDSDAMVNGASAADRAAAEAAAAQIRKHAGGQ